MTNFGNFASTPSGPARSVRAVTPADGVDLPDGTCKGLFVLTDGNLELVAADDANNASVTIPVVAGMTVPVFVRRVLSGTVATVLALY